MEEYTLSPELQQLRERLTEPRPTAELVEDFRWFKVSDKQIATAAGGVSPSAVRTWAEGRSQPRADAEDRLDALRVLLIRLLDTTSLKQPEGSRKWLLMRRIDRHRTPAGAGPPAYTTALEQIGDGRFNDAVDDLFAAFGQPAEQGVDVEHDAP